MSTLAVTLDAAGTLIHPARPVADTYADIATRHGARLRRDALGSAFAAAFPAMPPMAFTHVDDDTRERLERGWWRRLVRQVTEAAGGVDDFDTYFETLYTHYARADAWLVYAEVREVLETLRRHGLRLVVVSNFDSRLPTILDGLGLAVHFEAVLYSTAVGAAKPAAGIFEAALGTLGVEAGSALHVGDSRSADLDGARQAGLDALLLRRGAAADSHATQEIADLRGALAYLGLV